MFVQDSELTNLRRQYEQQSVRRLGQQKQQIFYANRNTLELFARIMSNARRWLRLQAAS
jgi:hypothetical protein